MTYASRDTSQHVKSWGQPPAQSPAGSPSYTVLLLLAPRTPYFPPKVYTNIYGGTPTNALYNKFKIKIKINPTYFPIPNPITILPFRPTFTLPSSP